MNKTLSYVLILFIFGILCFFPDSFSQTTSPHNVVRVVYFVPRGRTPQQDINAKLDKLIKDVQKFYADEMERHGFGRKTFGIETDRSGNVVIHRVNGNFVDTYYNQKTDEKVEKEVSNHFDFTKNIYLIVVDVSVERINADCGWGRYNWTTAGDWRGRAFIPASGFCVEGYVGCFITAHELGHAFGIAHDFNNDAYIMSYGRYRTELALCSAESLDTNRYFNPYETLSDTGKTMIQMLQPVASPPYGIRFRFEMSDPDGLQIAQLQTLATYRAEGPGQFKLLGCKVLNGEAQTVEFVTTELSTQSKSVRFRVTDGAGNFIEKDYPIDISRLLSNRIVVIPDRNLQAELRRTLGLRANTPIRQQDMLKLRQLRDYSRKIKKLNGLEHAKNLKYLYLQSNPISDITILKELPSLTVLSLSFNQISDFTPIAELTNLTSLDLSENPGDDISPIAKLTQLQTLRLRGLEIRDISFLSGFTSLRDLDLGNNQIKNINPLKDLTQLRNLWLYSNQISDLTPLSELVYLEVLGIWNNAINDLTSLASLTNLRSFHAYANQISDVTPLGGLIQLRFLLLRDNQIKNFAPLTKLHNLTQLQVAGNPIADRTPLQTLLERNPKLRLDIDPTQLTPVVVFKGATLPPMYWTDTATSGFYRLIGAKEAVENVASNSQNITGIAIDVAENKVYWTEQTGRIKGQLKSANLDGSNVRVVKSVRRVPRDLAIDVAGRKIYYTNSNGKIQRVNFDGSGFKGNLIKGLDAPDHIALDVMGGKIYWTEAGERICRANLNGAKIETLATDLGTLGGITVAGGKLYWTEEASKNSGKVQRSNLDGTNVQTLASLRSIPLGIAADPSGRKLYWTNAAGRIQRANLNGKSIKTLVRKLGTPTDIVLGIETVATMSAAAPISPIIVPDETSLLSNYPNPFNPETWIPYQLAKSTDVTFIIYAMDGQIIRRLELGQQPAGMYHSKSRAAYWDGRNNVGESVASGVYFYTLTAGNFTATQKMLILK